MFPWVLARLKEPSTWAGLSGLFMALGLSEAVVNELATAGAAVAGLIAVVLSEKNKPTE